MANVHVQPVASAYPESQSQRPPPEHVPWPLQQMVPHSALPAFVAIWAGVQVDVFAEHAAGCSIVSTFVGVVGLTYTQLELDDSKLLDGHRWNAPLSSQPLSYTP